MTDAGWRRPTAAAAIWETASPPPWHGYAPPSAPHNPMPAELPERVARLEEGQRHMHERHQAVLNRIEGQDSRLAGHQERLTQVESETRRVGPIETRLAAVEARWAWARERASYAIAALLLGLTASGNMTLDALLKMIEALRRLGAA